MNIHNKDVDVVSDSLEEFDGDAKESSSHLERQYDSSFKATNEYIKTLPDLQNGPASLIKGVNKQIQHVGQHAVSVY